MNKESKLKKLSKEAKHLRSLPRFSPQYSAWYNKVERTLEDIFGKNTLRVKQFLDIRFSVGVFTTSTPDSDFQDAYMGGLRRAELLLKDFSEETSEPEASPQSKPQRKIGKIIFIVHGHDEETKEKVSRFIEKLGFEALILHEQPNKGRTIIEKFEDYSDVPYAIILLTPDDEGYPKNKKEQVKSRARQNVIFELGFFIGKLGRENVCALYQEGVEIPSDYKGVLYIPLDKEDGWQLKLAKEMKAAGLSVDMNKVV